MLFAELNYTQRSSLEKECAKWTKTQRSSRPKESVEPNHTEHTIFVKGFPNDYFHLLFRHAVVAKNVDHLTAVLSEMTDDQKRRTLNFRYSRRRETAIHLVARNGVLQHL